MRYGRYMKSQASPVSIRISAKKLVSARTPLQCLSATFHTRRTLTQTINISLSVLHDIVAVSRLAVEEHVLLAGVNRASTLNISAGRSLSFQLPSNV